ncbi:hypothetical protein M0R45_027599 [Rubus argutus]|uniref:Uncharacterized protein n=1 Tax=Rubus argutus TaxID=59490 RepID=A0AAW1X230_RUBAR
MTLEGYEKVLEEKRKALATLKIEERKVDLDKDLKSMQQLSRKGNDETFIKLVSTLYLILIILNLFLLYAAALKDGSNKDAKSEFVLHWRSMEKQWIDVVMNVGTCTL